VSSDFSASPGGAAPEVCIGTDGAEATRRAIELAPARTAVWVGEAGDPALEEFRAEIGRRA